MASSANSILSTTQGSFSSNKPHQKTKLSTTKVKATLQSAYTIYLDSLAPTGRNSMKTLLHQSLTILGHKKTVEQFDWGQLTFEKIHLIRSTYIEAGYAVNSINLVLAGLKGVTKMAFNLGQLSAENMLRINAVKSLKGNAIRTGRRLSKPEITKLLSTCHKLKYPSMKSRDMAILLVGIGAGLRCSEICALNIDDVDLNNGLLLVREGKGRKSRKIYLAEEIIVALKQWIACRGTSDGSLFSKILKNGSVTRNTMSSSGLAFTLENLQHLANIPAFTPHDMRRTFITQLLEKGIDLNTVRQLAGHSDVSTTVRYDKRDLDWQRKASQAIVF